MPRKKTNINENSQDTVKTTEIEIVESKAPEVNIQQKSNKKNQRRNSKKTLAESKPILEVIEPVAEIKRDIVLPQEIISEDIDLSNVEVIDLSAKSSKKKKPKIKATAEVIIENKVPEVKIQEPEIISEKTLDLNVAIEEIKIPKVAPKSTKKKKAKKNVVAVSENPEILEIQIPQIEPAVETVVEPILEVVEEKSEPIERTIPAKSNKKKKSKKPFKAELITETIVAEKPAEIVAEQNVITGEIPELENLVAENVFIEEKTIQTEIFQPKKNSKKRKNKNKKVELLETVAETEPLIIEEKIEPEKVFEFELSEAQIKANAEKAALIAEKKRAKRLRRKAKKNQKAEAETTVAVEVESILEIIPKSKIEEIVDADIPADNYIVVDLTKNLFQNINLLESLPASIVENDDEILNEAESIYEIPAEISDEKVDVIIPEAPIESKSKKNNRKKKKKEKQQKIEAVAEESDDTTKISISQEIAEIAQEKKEIIAAKQTDKNLIEKKLEAPEIIVEVPAKFVSKLEKEIIPVHIIDSKDIKAVKIQDKKEPKHNQLIKVNEKKQLEKRKTSLKRLIPEYSIIPALKLLTNAEKSNPLITNSINKVDEFLRKELYIESGMKFILAVSGGVDSIVLLDIMAQLASKYYFTIYIGHFNHNLRGENSKKDEQFVKSLAEQYKLNYYHSSGNVKQFSEKNSISIEHSARTLRYNFYERTARTITADFVASAHNADDSAETFLINLMRGSGLTGLSGIPSKRHLVKNVLIVRPLINFKKSEIIEYAKTRNLKWREDESNSLMNYTRNKVRLDLLPKLRNDYNPSIVDTLNRTARLLQSADTIVDDIVRKNLPNLVFDVTTERFLIKISILQTFDEFIQGELIQSAMQKYFRSHPLNLNTIDRILSLVNSITGSIAEINNNYLVLRDRDYLIFSKKNIDVDINQRITKTGEFKIGKFKIILKEIKKADVKFNADPRIEYLDGDLLPNVLEIRNWVQGDTFQPLGMGTQKVSDYLTNIKMPLIDKPKVLVLKTKTDIIWLVGLRLSEKFKVTSETKTFISAEIKIIN